MDVKKVWTLYFSATGNTDKTANTIADALARRLEVPAERISFTRPGEREKEYSFTEGDLVVVASPTYAGTLPNKILPDFQGKLHGCGALAVAVVTFGNRSYDNALAELCAVLEGDGFHTVAGAAFACRHAFTDAQPDDPVHARPRGQQAEKPQRGDQVRRGRHQEQPQQLHSGGQLPDPTGRQRRPPQGTHQDQRQQRQKDQACQQKAAPSHLVIQR